MADWKKIIKSVAPTLAGVLGGPGASLAVKVIGEQFLGDKDASLEDIEQAVLGAKPEDLAKLKEIEFNFKARMKELDVNVLELTTKDVQSARKSGDTIKHWPQILLGFFTVGGFFTLLALIITGAIQIPVEWEKFLYMMIGSLLTYVAMVYRYFYGGSQNDERNLDKIYRSIPKD